MGKVVEKKKKKGRPSLLDLQKRNLKQQQQQNQQQQQQQQQQKRNSNSAPHSTANYKTAPVSTTTPIRRSTRRNPNPDASALPQKLQAEEDDVDGDGGEEEEEELDGKRREKKLKLVLRLPPNQKSSLNSGSLNSYGSDSNAEEDNAASEGNKKRKINAIGDGSGVGDSKKDDKSSSGTNPSNILKGATKLDSGPLTPLPDKKLLLFILDRIQKKDTYGVFSEPVDPEELPDYHEVIEHPMDFGTIRKKLTGGSYTTLEQFEKDVFLICSNAMQYNAPDTIYFRQARSIQELAKKNFENLRQDSDDNEPEPKVARRGRPPTKNLKKPPGRPSLERAGSEFSSDATLATGGENTAWTNYDLRKGSHASDRSGLADSSGRFHVPRSIDAHASWLADSKFEKNDDFTGSLSRGNSKQGKKQFVHEENRRNTYMQSNPSACGREPSVFTTFDGERKHLMPVGIQSEYGYARSLARFAANLGSVAWKIASKKIERSLPAGVKYGPGWVAENDLIQNRPLLSGSQLPGQPSPSPSQPIPDLANSSSVATTTPVESNRDKLADKPEGDSSDKREPSATSTLDGRLSKPLTLSATTSSPSVANKPCEPHTAKAEPVEGLKPQTGFNVLNSNVGPLRPRPSFQVRQGPMIRPGMNGYNGAYGLNLAAQMGKLIGTARPAGLNFQSSPMIDPKSRTNTNFINQANSNANSIDAEDSKFSDNRSTVNPGNSLSNPGNEAPAALMPGLRPRPSWSGLSPHQKSDSGLSPLQKQDSVPPDLNVMFQSPGSPSSSKVDSTQPDLALQL